MLGMQDNDCKLHCNLASPLCNTPFALSRVLGDLPLPYPYGA
jgi:hypothetical protein